MLYYILLSFKLKLKITSIVTLIKMSNFPLYESLKSKKDIQVDKPDFIKKFKTLSLDKHELVYALIRSYQIDHKIDILSSSLPFNGLKLRSKGKIKFNFTNFPEKTTNYFISLYFIKSIIFLPFHP